MVWFLCLLPGLAAAWLPAGEAGDRGVLAAGAVSAGVLLVAFRRWRTGQAAAPEVRGLVVGAVVLRLLVWAGPVRFDDDLWRYLWDGIVTVEGISPYRFAPRDVAEYDAAFDPLILEEASAGELARLAARAADPAVGEVLGRINFPHLPTIYPPSSQIAFGVAALLAPGSERLWRLLALGADVAVVLLVLALLRALKRPQWWLAGYAVHPLPALEFAAGGHQDPLGIAFLLAAVLALVRSRRALAGAGLALASGVKIFPLVLVLPWARGLGVRGVAGVVATLTVIVVPFWWLGPPDPAGAGAYVGHWEFFSGPYAVLGVMAELLWLDELLPAGVSATRVLLLVLLAGLAGASRFWRRSDMRGGLVWLEVLLILSPVVDPWYVPWGLAVGLLRGSTAWLLMAALVPSAYFGYSPEGHFWALRCVVWVPFLWVWAREMRQAGEPEPLRGNPP